MEERELLGGDFQLLRPLVYGGMASFYLAEQRSTGRLYAVKTMLQSDMKEESNIRQFLQEPRTMMRIPSDHVAQVIRVGDDDTEDTRWFAMELLDGETLAERINREGYLEPGEAFAILAQVCSALDAAHRRGIVHCNIKPDNIYLSRSDRGETIVKVLGFGNAKWVKEPEIKLDYMTAAAQPLLSVSPFSMAPELLSASTQASPASDIWSLGLLAYEMLTGESYWGPRRSYSNISEIIVKIATSEIIRASARVKQLRSSVAIPEGFDNWFAQCVTREPSRRFSTAGDALESLTTIVEQNHIRPIWSVVFPELRPGSSKAMLKRLRTISADSSLLLKRVVSGSVVLLLEGPREAYDTIRSLHEEKRLSQALGLIVQDVEWRGEPQTEWPKSSTMPGNSPGVQVFISYARIDEHLCDELLIHLASVRRQGVIREWYDRLISPGANEHDATHEALEGSQIFLPLVSAHYLASRYCFDVEMRRALERHESGDAQIVPVIVRACDWEYPPLGSLRALPTEGRPVTSWANRDEAWVDVIRGIKRAVEISPPR